MKTSVIILLLILTGCTGLTYQQQEALAIRGNYTSGVDCKKMVVASGSAANIIAQDAKAVEVTRKNN